MIKRLKTKNLKYGVLVISLIILISANIVSASDAGTETREITGKVTYDKDRLILQSGKEKIILAMLAPAALDSLNFHPATGDTISVKGFMSKGALVVKDADWKGKTYAFRDSLYQFTRSEPGTWVVDAKGCISCKLCVNFCPVSAITMEQTANGLKAVIDPEKCVGCNICEAGNGSRYMGCPTKAIKK